MIPDPASRLFQRLMNPKIGLGMGLTLGGGRLPGVYINTTIVADLATGTVAQLQVTGLSGAVTYSKDSGSANVTVGSDGAVSIGTGMNHGTTATFTATATNGTNSFTATFALTAQLAGLHGYTGGSQMAAMKAGLALVSGGTGRAMWLGVGPSNMRGWKAGGSATGLTDARRHSWLFKLGTALTARGVSMTNQGFFGAGNNSGITAGEEAALTLGSGWAPSGAQATRSIGGSTYANTTTTSNNNLVFGPGVAWDKCKHWYIQDAGYGLLRYKINSGGSFSASIDAGAGGAALASFEAVGTLSTSTVHVARVSGTVRSVGWLSYNSAVTAVDIMNGGFPGATVSQINDTTNPYSYGNAAFAIGVSLFWFQAGLGEYIAGQSTQTLYDGTVTFITRALASGANVVVFLPTPPDETFAAYNGRLWAPYADAIIAACVAMGVPYYDTRAAIPVYDPTLYYTDDPVHLNDTGTDRIAAKADRVAQILAL